MTNEDIEDRIKLINLLREAEAEVEAYSPSITLGGTDQNRHGEPK